MAIFQNRIPRGIVVDDPKAGHNYKDHRFSKTTVPHKSISAANNFGESPPHSKAKKNTNKMSNVHVEVRLGNISPFHPITAENDCLTPTGSADHSAPHGIPSRREAILRGAVVQSRRDSNVNETSFDQVVRTSNSIARKCTPAISNSSSQQTTNSTFSNKNILKFNQDNISQLNSVGVSSQKDFNTSINNIIDKTLRPSDWWHDANREELRNLDVTPDTPLSRSNLNIRVTEDNFEHIQLKSQLFYCDSSYSKELSPSDTSSLCSTSVPPSEHDESPTEQRRKTFHFQSHSPKPQSTVPNNDLKHNCQDTALKSPLSLHRQLSSKKDNLIPTKQVVSKWMPHRQGVEDKKNFNQDLGVMSHHNHLNKQLRVGTEVPPGSPHLLRVSAVDFNKSQSCDNFNLCNSEANNVSLRPCTRAESDHKLNLSEASISSKTDTKSSCKRTPSLHISKSSSYSNSQQNSPNMLALAVTRAAASAEFIAINTTVPDRDDIILSERPKSKVKKSTSVKNGDGSNTCNIKQKKNNRYSFLSPFLAYTASPKSSGLSRDDAECNKRLPNTPEHCSDFMSRSSDNISRLHVTHHPVSSHYSSCDPSQQSSTAFTCHNNDTPTAKSHGGGHNNHGSHGRTSPSSFLRRTVLPSRLSPSSRMFASSTSLHPSDAAEETEHQKQRDTISRSIRRKSVSLIRTFFTNNTSSPTTNSEQNVNCDGASSCSNKYPYYLLPQAFEDLLKSPEYIQMFRDYLAMEHSTENLDFWLAVESFKSSTPENELTASGHALVVSFVEAGSPNEININNTLRNALVETQHFDRSSFDQAQKSIVHLMKNDSYPRFLKFALGSS